MARLRTPAARAPRHDRPLTVAFAGTALEGAADELDVFGVGVEGLLGHAGVRRLGVPIVHLPASRFGLCVPYSGGF